MRDDRFQRRHHRVLLHDAARGRDVLLKRIRVRAAPVLVEFVDRAGVDVARRRDAAHAAPPHVLEQKDLASREHVEARFRERVEHRFRIVPVAGGIFHTRDGSGKILQQPLDQGQRDRHLRHRRDVVEIDLQPGIADALDHLGEIAVQALVGDAFVVKGREHQDARAPERGRVRGEPHRVGESAAAGARHKCRGGNTLLDQGLQQDHALVDRERVRFAVRSEHGEAAAAVGKQPLAVAHIALAIGREVALEGRDHGGEDA